LKPRRSANRASVLSGPTAAGSRARLRRHEDGFYSGPLETKNAAGQIRDGRKHRPPCSHHRAPPAYPVGSETARSEDDGAQGEGTYPWTATQSSSRAARHQVAHAPAHAAGAVRGAASRYQREHGEQATLRPCTSVPRRPARPRNRWPNRARKRCQVRVAGESSSPPPRDTPPQQARSPGAFRGDCASDSSRVCVAMERCCSTSDRHAAAVRVARMNSPPTRRAGPEENSIRAAVGRSGVYGLREWSMASLRCRLVLRSVWRDPVGSRGSLGSPGEGNNLSPVEGGFGRVTGNGRHLRRMTESVWDECRRVRRAQS